MKKIIAILLSTSLALGILPNNLIFASQFTDVDQYTSYYDSINWMADNGVVEGYEDTTFKPENCVDRIEFLKMMYATLEEDVSEADVELIFTDTEENQWYSQYLKQAVLDGAVGGYPDGSFQPNHCVNKAEGSKMAVLAFNNNQVPELKYYDDVPVDVYDSKWYYPTLSYSLSADLMGQDHIVLTAEGDELFFPGEFMTRAEVAEMLYRMKTIADNNIMEYNYWYEPLPLTSNLFTNDCQFDHTKLTHQTILSSTLPKDGDMVLVLDQTGENNLIEEEYINLLEELFSGGTDEIISFLENDFELGLSMNIEDYYYGDVDLTFVSYVGNADEFERSIARTMQSEWGKENISCQTNNDSVTWDIPLNDFFYARSGNFVSIASTADLRDQTLEYLESGNGLYVDQGDAFAYFYTDFQDLFGEIMGEINDIMYQNTAYLDEILEMEIYAYLEDDGVLVHTDLELESGSQMLDVYSGESGNLSSVVPGEGLLFYEEITGLGPSLDYFMGTSILLDELPGITERPLALSVNIVDNYPTASAYLKLEDGDEFLANSLDLLIEATILQDYTLGEIAVHSTDESGLGKFTLDTSQLDDWTKSDYESIFGEGAILELYYGVIDNVYVLALYPDFPSVYGINPVSSQSRYKAGISAVDSNSNSLAYFDLEMLYSYLESFQEEDLKEVLAFLKYFSFLATSSEVNGNTMESDIFIGM